MHIQSKQTGLTLLELIIAMAISAILIGIAVPSLSSVLQRNETRAALAEVNATLSYARNEAVAMRTQVSICGSKSSSDSNNSSKNSMTCSGEKQWDEGWMIFLDKNGDGALTTADCADLQECILQVNQLSARNVRVQSDANFLTFDWEGALIDSGADTIQVCPESDESFFTVNVSAAGSKRTQKESGQCA